MDSVLIVILAGAAAAGFAQGLSGFAFSMVALSFWAWVIGPQLSAPMAVFGALAGQLVALPFVWRGFSFKLLLPMALGGLVGVPFGALVLRGLDPALFRLALGLLLIVYAPVAFFGFANVEIKGPRPLRDALAGWCGGVLGGISGVAGAIPALWATMRGWSKDEQRGVVQVFNIVMHVTTLIAYAVTGTLTGEVFGWFVWITPTIIVPAVAGVLLFNRLDVVAFRRMILGLLFVSGITLIAGSLPGVLG